MSGRAVSVAEAKAIVELFCGGRSMHTLAWVYGLDVEQVETILRRALHAQDQQRKGAGV